jgi:glycosyltransferase involved in cell wall biosynthesis
MTAGRFMVVSCGRNKPEWLAPCFDSIAEQTDKNFQVCVVDDASDDGRSPAQVERYCEAMGWKYILQSKRRGAMFNQVAAIETLEPEPDDVIVLVDSDDRLAHHKVFDRLRKYYEGEVDMTYGSYKSEPHSPTCSPAMAYPPDVIRRGTYREYARTGGGLLVNHLRTFKHKLFEQLDYSDFRWPDGEWFSACCDTAIMIPCLELSRGRHRFIDEVLYIYNSENPSSDWRTQPREVDRVHAYILQDLPRKS